MPTDEETPKEEHFEEVQSAEPPPKEPEVDEGPKGRSVRGKPAAKEG